MIAALLGVLKAGSFFVLLDPTIPVSRLRAILEDMGASLIVCDRKMAPLAREVAGQCDTVDFDDLDASLSDENLDRIISPDTVAAIVYTSGSTGEPKGIMQTHRACLHFVMGEQDLTHFCPDDRVIRLGSFSTGGGVMNILKLLTGCSLHPFDIRKRGFSEFASWLTSQRITTLKLGAAIFRAFVGTLRGDEMFPDLRIVHVTSDRVTLQDVEAYRKHFPTHCILIHGLGTSEAHTLTNFSMDKRTSISGNIVPVGYAVEGLNVMLLDDDGKEVGAGEVGEIAVRSRYVSPGYWRRPELTKAKFTRDSGDGNEALY